MPKAQLQLFCVIFTPNLNIQPIITVTMLNNPYIEYFSRLFDQREIPKHLKDFANGQHVNQLLSSIKQFPVMTLQQNPCTFSQFFCNLKEIYKKIEEFWNKQLDKELDCQEIDLVEIAHHQNQKEIMKFLSLILQTFVLSAEKEYFISKILETSPQTQNYFMAIVEQTLEKKKLFSPRKQHEQRLYDKIMQLDHENENLQNVIVQLCKQKQDHEGLQQKAADKILSLEMEIKRLNQYLADYSQTPTKRRDIGIYDTNEKNADLALNLKQKMIEMSKQFEKQLVEYREQINFLGQRSQLVSQLENELEMYKVKDQSNSKSMEQFKELSKKNVEMKLELIEKDENLNELIRKYNAKNLKLQEAEEKLIEKEVQLERKNVQMEELTFQKGQVEANQHPSNGSSLQRSLSEHCPQFANNQAQFLYDCNKKLREQLERTSSRLKDKEIELQKLKKQYQKRQTFQIENKKLFGIIQQMNDQHDEQKSLILGCLHEFRLKTLNELAPRERARKQEIKASLKNENGRFNRGNLRKIEV